MKALLLIAVSLATGYGLGATPVINEYLHWNLWFIVPVSGLILGLLLKTRPHQQSPSDV